MPRDPEVLHAYCVRDVGYWRGNPVYVEERVVQVDRVTEVTHIREIQRVREVEKNPPCGGGRESGEGGRPPALC